MTSMSAPQAESRYASWVLRLLLSPDAVADGLGALDWDVLLRVARANRVLVRTAERLAAGAIAVPERFAAAVARERRRIQATLALMQRVSRACQARHIAFLFPKAFQDYPDFGDDVDLLVLTRSTRVDGGIIEGLSASPVPRDWGERIAGAVTYRVTGCPSPLDVQHGRLGIVGEHDAFPQVLIEHARVTVVEGIEFAEPPPEDQLVLQGLQRVWGRLRIALCDVVFTMSTIRRGALDWDYILATARRHGALAGLGCYLSYVDQIHRDVFWQPLVAEPMRGVLGLRGWGRVEFHEDGYRFPIARVNSRLYVRQLGGRIAARDWTGAARLFLIPAVAAARAFHRLARGLTPAAAPPRGNEKAMRTADAPIRVLMITSEWPVPDGRPRTTYFIKRQAEFLQAAGVQVDVFHFKGAKNPWNYLRAWVRARRRMSQHPYDLVHAQFGMSGLLALPKLLPLVVTFRGDDVQGIVGQGGRITLAGRVLQLACRLVARWTDAAIVVSEHMKDYLPRSVRPHVIPSGLDLNLFRVIPRDEARGRLGLALDKRLVLFVGNPADPRKRHPLARQAVDILNQSTPAELVVAWGTPHTDIPLLMNACDVLVFPSAQEGSPNTVKEALACNLPVVSVPVGDVPLRLRGIEGCELCADERPETIAAALERVLRRGQRIAGRDTVTDLDERQTTQQVIAVYRSVTTQRGRQPVRVVLPQRERSCVLCNAEREQWEALGMALGCGPEAMLVGAFNKAQTLELAQACGLRIPPTRFPQSLVDCHTAAGAVGYPCILKPRFSDFWDGERFVADHGARYVP